MEKGYGCRKVAVANEKGGVGKTVMTLNLGAALSLKEQKVLIVDMDPQSNATRGLGVDPADALVTVYDLMKAPGPIDPFSAVLKTRWDRLDLIPSTVDLAGAEVELVEIEGREYRLREALQGLSDAYDFILVDTPPSLSLLTVNVFAYAREILVPCQTHPYSYEALTELFDTVAAIRNEIHPDLKITGIVATFVDSRTRVSRLIFEKLKADPRYGPLLFDTPIRMNTTIADSALSGKPVVFYRKGSFGSADFRQLADELMASSG